MTEYEDHEVTAFQPSATPYQLPKQSDLPFLLQIGGILALTAGFIIAFHIFVP
jgi:hypothetical protein